MPQAKDIQDGVMLLAVSTCTHLSIGANFTDICEMFPEFPEPVVRAKLRKMIKRGLVTGCTCGCRGDFLVVTQLKLNLHE